MSVYAGPNISENGLLLHLDAGSSKSYSGSGTTWYDLSGSNNDATIVNTPTYANGVFTLNGNTQYMTVTNLGNYTSALSIGAWVKPAGQARVDPGSIMSKGSYYAQTFTDFPVSLGYGIDNTFSIVFDRGNDWSGDVAIVSSTCPINNWYYVSATFQSNGQSYLYVNGALVGNAATNFSLSSTNYPWMIGQMSVYGGAAPYGKAFNGSIAHVSFYNRVITSSEVSQNFNALRGRFGI